jgi:Rieske Fe-S protein
MNRRSFWSYILRIAGFAFGTFLVYISAKFMLFSNYFEKKREIPAEAIQDLEINVPKHFPEAESWVIKMDSESILALDDKCSHLGCRFKWVPESENFHCPCHGSEFDRKGKVKKGPATKDIKSLRLVRDEKRIRFMGSKD